MRGEGCKIPPIKGVGVISIQFARKDIKGNFFERFRVQAIVGDTSLEEPLFYKVKLMFGQCSFKRVFGGFCHVID
jgi:hypothetical protein